MAKTRVYELARDLNLTNQILLSRLDELDISVKSHMSSLDDEAVAKVKTVIFGKKRSIHRGDAHKTDRHSQTQKKSADRGRGRTYTGYSRNSRRTGGR